MTLPPTLEAGSGFELVGMALCRLLGNGLREIQSALPTKRTARVLLVEMATGSDKPRPATPVTSLLFFVHRVVPHHTR